MPGPASAVERGRSWLDPELLKGSLTLLVTRLLANRAMYGYEIIGHIAEKSHNLVRLREGSLYPALHALVAQGLLESEWRIGTDRRFRRGRHPARGTRLRREPRLRRCHRRP